VSGIVRRCRVSVGMFSAMSAYCRDFFGEVGLVSGRVRRGRLSVGMCSARLGYCRYVFDEVVFLSELVRRGRIIVGTFLTRWVIVGICSAMSAN